MELILYSVLAVAFIWFCVAAARHKRDKAPPHSYGSNVVHNFFRIAFNLLLPIGVGWFIWWLFLYFDVGFNRMELILYSVLAVAFIWFCVAAARHQRDEAPPHSYGSNVVHNFFRLAFVLLLLIGVGRFIWWLVFESCFRDWFEAWVNFWN
jgi:Ca2+/Na+ antiporter